MLLWGQINSNIKDFKEFSKILTTDLRKICNDRHLWVSYKLEWLIEEIKMSRAAGEEKKKLEEKWYNEAKRTNFGFQKVEILEGNIGYLHLKDFGNTKYAGKILAGAMSFLANSDAVIIDLRQNGGGYGWTVQLLASYFFDADSGPVHLEDVYFRPGNSTYHMWTLPSVPGKRLQNKDLYILTSGRTFSAAESFAYIMKSLKRATIIGETTKGGAHPTSDYLLMEDVILTVPTGRSINPVTKTDWEGVGVEPDIKTGKAEALRTAHIKALTKLKNLTKNDTEEYEKLIEKLKNENAAEKSGK